MLLRRNQLCKACRIPCSPPLCRRTGFCIADRITMSERQLPPFWPPAESAPRCLVRPPQLAMLPFSYSGQLMPLPRRHTAAHAAAAAAPRPVAPLRRLAPNCSAARLATCGCRSGCSARTVAPHAPWQAAPRCGCSATCCAAAAAAPPQWIQAALTASPGPRP